MATVLSSNPAIQDLKVQIQESTLVMPSQKTDEKSLFLCNIDQFLNYNIPTAHFFLANPEYPPEIVAKRLKIALEKVLVPYDFMAGRLKLNHESGRLEINCNMAGVGFVVASSEYKLENLGDLVCPNPGFKQLAPETLDSLVPEDDQPLSVFQVTSFKCGGFAIGMSTNHVLLDGLSARGFMENLATQAFDSKPLAFIPCHDRHLLAARSPPRIEFLHPELLKPDMEKVCGPPAVYDCKREELVSKVFKFSAKAINYLKEKAKKAKTSSLTVVAAVIWRCKVLSWDNKDGDRVSILLNAMNIRSILNPPLPACYCGNGVLVTYSSAKCGEVETGSLWEVAEKVVVGQRRMNDEYLRSMIDWLEVKRGVPFGDYLVASWMRLGFDQVEYPWGKPVFSGPVVNHRKDICWVFPDPDQLICALVSLPCPEMERFEAHFHKFFAQMCSQE